jgi:hypothetical protein
MRTSAEKARRSQMNIFVRLCGCAYLGYIIVQLARDKSGDMSDGLRYGVVALFVLLAAAIVAVTVVDFIRNFKAGAYKASSYTDDTDESVEAFRARQAAASGGGKLSDGGAATPDGAKGEDREGTSENGGE